MSRNRNYSNPQYPGSHFMQQHHDPNYRGPSYHDHSYHDPSYDSARVDDYRMKSSSLNPKLKSRLSDNYHTQSPYHSPRAFEDIHDNREVFYHHQCTPTNRSTDPFYGNGRVINFDQVSRSEPLSPTISYMSPREHAAKPGQYVLLPVSYSACDMREIDDIDRQAVDMRQEWLSAQPILRRSIQEDGNESYIERAKDKIYWNLYDVAYTAYAAGLNPSFKDSSDHFLNEALIMIDTSIVLKKDLWFAYHLKYKIYCAKGDSENANKVMVELENILEKEHLYYELLNICYATKIYAALEKGDLIRAGKYISEAQKRESELGALRVDSGADRSPETERSFKVKQPLEVVKNQYKKSIKESKMPSDHNATTSFDSSRVSESPNTSLSEDSNSSKDSFSGSFARACDIFRDNLAKNRMQNSIEELRKDVSFTRGQIDALELKISILESSINEIFKELESKTVDLEGYLRTIDPQISDQVVQYSKAYVLTMMRAHAVSSTLSGDELQINTDNIFKSAAIALFGAIPFCGSIVSKVVDAGIECIQLHNIRSNATKMLRMISNDSDMYEICKKVLTEIVQDKDKCLEIINKNSEEKIGVFSKIYAKICSVSKYVEGNDIYTTEATKLAYHDAMNAISEGIKLYGKAQGANVFANSQDVFEIFAEITIGHKLVAKLDIADASTKASKQNNVVVADFQNASSDSASSSATSGDQSAEQVPNIGANWDLSHSTFV